MPVMNTFFLKRDIVYSLAVGFTFCFIFNFALTVNPFTLYSGYDQSIFEQVGLGMLQGRIPYVDLFDHKGFLLYVINAIGLWISPGHLGIYILLSLYLSATFLCWLRICDYIVNPSMRYFPPLITMLFACLCEGGNMTETWSLFAISLPVYYVVRYIYQNQSIQVIEWLYIGMCIGVAANLRLNNIGPILAVCIFMLFDLCYKKSFLELLHGAMSVLIGFCIITICLVFLYMGLYGPQHMNDYWFCNIVFNFIYVEHFAHKPLWEAAPFYFPLSMLLVMLCTVRNFRSRMMWFTLIIFILTLFTTGTAYFSHYFTMFTPVILLSISLSLGRSVCLSARSWCCAGMGLLVLMIITFALFYQYFFRIADEYIAREKAITECRDKLNGLNKRQKASIWNYNMMMAGANILQCSGLVQCNKIFLPFQADKQYGISEKGELWDICPEVILIDEFTRWDKDISENALESVGSRKDSAFIAQNYQLLHRSSTLIHNKGVCILVKVNN